MSAFDMVRTLTEFTALSIALNYERHLPSLPSLVVLTGGGAANPVLVEGIQRELRKLRSDIAVTNSEAFVWPHQAIEPAAFALLAKLRMEERPGNIPETTGARHSAILGQVCR